MDSVLCILYTISIGACLGAAALMIDHALPAHAPRRWIWSVTIALSMIVPPLYQSRHRSQLPSALSSLDPGVLASVDASRPIVMKLWVLASALLLAWGLANAWRVSRVVRMARKEQSD